MSNGAPFLLLNRQVGWQTLLTKGVTVGETLRLQALPGFSRPLADAEGSFGGLAMPTGLALDSAGRLYVLDGPAARICRFDSCDERFESLPHLGGIGRAPRRFNQPRSIAISCADDLYVADTGNRRVQIFALKGLTLRAIWGPYRVIASGATRRLERITDARLVGERPDCPPAEENCRPEAVAWPEGTWQPWDVALTPDGRTYVSDYANGLIHVFDARGRWQGAFDSAEEGTPLLRPTHLALDCHGNLYIAQEGQGDIVVLDAEGHFLRRVERPEQVEDDFAPLGIGFDPSGRLLVCAGRPGRLYAYSNDEKSAIHCHAFKGHGCALLVDAGGRLYVADGLSKAIHVLESDVTFAAEGVVHIGPLDSRLYRCQWHRLALQLDISPGTSVQVDTFSAEAERPLGEIVTLPEERWATRQIAGQLGSHEWDCLVLSSPGRYLWLRLTLRGDGQATPVIRRIIAHYPRASSLRHLPAVYREDPESAAFLDRFLSIFDRVMGAIGDVVGNIAGFFDPLATPAAGRGPGQLDFLTWLATWIGLALEQHWPEEKRRRLVEEAHRLYALRGTLAGLRLHIAIYAGVEPQLLEHYRLRRWLMLDGASLGNGTVLWGSAASDRLQLGVYSRIGDFQLKDSGDPLTDPFDIHAHRFTVYLPWSAAGELERQTVQRIIGEAKPAHTQGYLEMVEPLMRVGRQSIVGVNTLIGRYPSGVTLESTRLGESSLTPSAAEAGAPTLQIGRSRVGSNTRLA
jgi:phage tail-like protein